MRWVFLTIVLWACGSEATAPEAPPPPRVPTPEEVVVEASPSPWPTETASLEESLARFEDEASCVARLRQSVPVELAQALADLGYDAVLDDVCRDLRAGKSGDPAACESLGATGLRDGCRLRVALATRTPEHCPPARAMEGRDPSCLAWTTGVTRLCDATVGDARRRCVAVATNDARACGRDASCAAAVRRYGSSVVASEDGDDLDEEGARDDVALSIVHTSAGEARRTEHVDTVARGVALAAEGCASRARVEVGGPLSEGAQLVLEVVLRVDESGAWSGDVRDLRFAERRLAVPSVVMDAVADELVVQRQRGGAIAMRVRGRLGTDATLEVVLRSFVRDFEAGPAACGAR
ncbi:MAG: hypothetical protein MUE69_04735 [Myxococcota bacterium]|nr:hypothetical protein [Myxococcota bacterium]